MHIQLLRLENFRNLGAIEVAPDQTANFFYGDNGAGKTSLLESLYLLSRGRSFRTAQLKELIGPAEETFRIYLEVCRGDKTHRLGLERDGVHWRARLDGQDLKLLSEMTRVLPLILMEPNSHQLVSGSPEGRRRFLDWGVFHVEPRFLDDWRRYSRALKQRNAALRQRQSRMLDTMDAMVAEFGESLHRRRKAYFDQLAPAFGTITASLSPEQRDVSVRYSKGWKGESLEEALQQSRERDFDRGNTHAGPHRADLVLSRENRAVRTLLSRGEQKSLAAAMLMTQAHLMCERGEKPLVLLDDLSSEFDQQHYRDVLAQASASAGQLWVTGIQSPPSSAAGKVFHVERGHVREMV